MEIKDFFSGKTNKLKNIINVYVCGPTVYNSPHIGNMRPIIIFDILNKVASLNNEVIFTHNITDIDDKIIEKAIAENVSEKVISDRYTKEYIDLLKELNIKTPTYMPKVSENIEGMILFIEKLIEKGFAYESKGNVYFEISKEKTYGQNANLKLGELDIQKNENLDKKDPKDFTLWKKTNEGITFDSNWGKGRPGWHTECAYFIMKIYGNEGIDIHGGGIDLRFPHHVNEMTQYLAQTGNELSKNWAYIGHVKIDQEKMSKSLNNVFLAKDFIKKYSSNILRVLLISTSYTKPIDVDENSIKNSIEIIEKIKNAILKFVLSNGNMEPKHDDKIVEILNKNIDTSKALTHIFNLISEINNNEKSSFSKLLFSLKLIGIKLEINQEVLDLYKKALLDKDYNISDKYRTEIVKI